MPIIIKEIQVKTTIHKSNQQQSIGHEQSEQLKKEIIRDLKDYLRKEHLRKNER